MSRSAIPDRQAPTPFPAGEAYGSAGAALPGMALTRLAPAKINLALHVVGQRADGYHLLESIVTFADAGDRVGVSEAAADRFTVSGPFASHVPLDAEGATGNLVLKARDGLRALAAARGLAAGPVHLHLEKNLPVQSGIGGGSADAAATLSLLSDLWDLGSVFAPPSPSGALLHLDLAALALTLGADVPMCLAGVPALITGIGEGITPLPTLPALPAILVNPRVGVSTPAIFRLLTQKTNPPLTLPAPGATPAEWLSALAAMRNDLAPPARTLEPAIGAVEDALADAGAVLVRMSGSGATCFGLFADRDARDRAATQLGAERPGWYMQPCNTRGAGDDKT